MVRSLGKEYGMNIDGIRDREEGDMSEGERRRREGKREEEREEGERGNILLLKIWLLT